MSPEFLAVFRAAAGSRGVLTFERFMELALYHPDVGYYRQTRRRIGYGGETDFFTASTSGPVFGELLAAATVRLLGEAGLRPEEVDFVELGAEPTRQPGTGPGVLAGVSHPFRSARAVTLGETAELAGACAVFSNELFDAQPFRRFRFEAGGWRELGVAATADGLLDEVSLPLTSAPAVPLPAAAPEGYGIDAPFAATALADRLAAQPWHGVFIACDYGKSWQELVEAAPAGTARAYFRHTQSNDLLARAGDQDLTCHICWDWLTDALQRRGFRNVTVDSQEGFFVRQAGDYLARVTADEAARLSPRKLALMQLLHPAHLGQKFQVLHGLR